MGAVECIYFCAQSSDSEREMEDFESLSNALFSTVYKSKWNSYYAYNEKIHRGVDGQEIVYGESSFP